MSMLAERKRKVKWSLNPRGKAWSQDSSKFGQKMLEKMGWQQGKGLGPDGKGITEHIRTTYKNDNKGMGFKESNDQWTEHEDNFTSLLESLGKGTAKPEDVKINSLERKSETSRHRVHYHKFTKGKDLSKYSEKDLANIFGKKTLKDSKREVPTETCDSNGDQNKYESSLLFNAGSMRDYFKKKLPNFGNKNGFVVGKNGVLKKEDSESDNEARPSFGFGYKSEDGGTVISEVKSYESSLENVPINGDCEDKSKEVASATFVSYLDEANSKKKNKKKRKGEECVEHSILSPKKKPKNIDEEIPKKKSRVKVEKNMGLSNPAFNPLPTPLKIQKHVLNTIQESLSENSDLEDGSPKTIEIKAEVYVNTPNEICEQGKGSEMSKRKKKQSQNSENIKVFSSEEKKSKKKKNSNGIENVLMRDIEDTPTRKQGNASVVSEDCTRAGPNPYEIKIKKKKKDGKLAIDSPNFEESAHESRNTPQSEEKLNEVKSKKKRKADVQFACDNPNFKTTLENPIDSSQFELNPYEVKVKEKKRKKVKENESALDNPSGSAENSSKQENPFELKVKPKKKKVKEETFALSNPSFDASAESSTSYTQVEENPYEVKVKQKKNKAKEGAVVLSNPSFYGSAERFTNSSKVEEKNPHEVKVKQKKKVKEETFAQSNPNFNASAESFTESSQVEENPYEVKVTPKKKKKIKEETFAQSNPSFNTSAESFTESSQVEENPYEVKVTPKKKKKIKEETFAVSNPSFNGSENCTDSSQVEENPYEVKAEKSKKKKRQEVDTSMKPSQLEETSYEITGKKKKKKEAFAIDNPQFDSNCSAEEPKRNNALEVERKKNKPKKSTVNGIDNPALNLDASQSDIQEVDLVEIEESDIMLNVVTTPIVTESKPRNRENIYSVTKVNSVKRTKSVRFSNVTQERIIPSNDELRNGEIEIESEIPSTQVTNGHSEGCIDASPLTSNENQRRSGKKRKLGLDNAAFDKQKNTLEENLNSISKTIDTYQAEIENDINEKKLETFQMEDVMVGEVGNPHGKNEQAPDGSVLRFKYAQFRAQTPFYQLNKTGSKKSYKHLIKGDIVVKFKNSNIHEIDGYAVKTKNV